MPPLSRLAALAAGLLLTWFAPERARAEDRVHVYYDGAGCPSPRIEVEVYDREEGLWQPHPTHAAVQTPSCQVEDAGGLLNELRWRCAALPRQLPGPWRPLDVFDPSVMSHCAVVPIPSPGRDSTITILSPEDGVAVQAPEPLVTLEGTLAVDSREGTLYEVVWLIDRAATPEAVAAQVQAARYFLGRVRSRLGALRIAVLSYPNPQPAPGEFASYRLELAASQDAVAIDAALYRLRDAALRGERRVPEAIDAALQQLRSGREGAQRVIVLGIDGSQLDGNVEPAPDHPWVAAARRVAEADTELHWFALGGLAADDPALARRTLEHARGSFRRIAPRSYGSAYASVLELPVAEEVWVELPEGRGRVDADVNAEGRFVAQVPVVAGSNPLRVRARMSGGRESERRFDLVFDASQTYENILARERARIRQAQQRRLEVHVEESGTN